ncbi:uncharacterized protein [Palaemon carinicauda]|uniref:uncharacterized protein n=1 Tax=Palaemon carinicauda TaxID=392227 RepID=UPI0035B69967
MDPILKARLKDANRVWRRKASNALRDLCPKIPALLRKQLKPWSTAKSLSNDVRLQYPPPSVTIYTDASEQGWGGHFSSKKVQGQWSIAFQKFHISVLEAMAVFLTLKRLCPKTKSHVKLVIDSNAIVHRINRQGSRSPQINHVILAILSLAKRKKWHLSAVHLEGVRNVTADTLSRSNPQETEWSLDIKSFCFILEEVPELQIDLFAMSFNIKLPRYVAPNLNSEVTGIDVMSLDWYQWSHIYLFPPFNLLLKILNKLCTFKGTAALVGPKWPKSNWYPLVLELKPLQIPLPSLVLSQIVQQTTVFASSWITKSLQLMIFSPSRLKENLSCEGKN